MSFYSASYAQIKNVADVLTAAKAQLNDSTLSIQSVNISVVVDPDTGETGAMTFSWNEQHNDWQVSVG